MRFRGCPKHTPSAAPCRSGWAHADGLAPARVAGGAGAVTTLGGFGSPPPATRSEGRTLLGMRWMARLRRRSRREWETSALVLTGLLGYVTLVYAVVVLFVGALLGRSPSSPAIVLSVIATALVALTFDPAPSLLGHYASRPRH